MGNVRELVGQVENLARRLAGTDILGGDAWDVRADLADNEAGGLVSAASFAAQAAMLAWEFEAGSTEPAVIAAAAVLMDVATELRREADDALDTLRREVGGV